MERRYELPTVQSADDWMASTFTCFILIAASAVLTAVRARGSPFACDVPQTYSGEWAQTAEVECFMKGLHFPWNVRNHDSPLQRVPLDGAEPRNFCSKFKKCTIPLYFLLL
ncbi:hypothetical protein GCK72_011545 [Caenorhabditis remanei]|uniref:Innexin n=1 Tax=Caenorhabditis remanei TaxID=31234 RepID=A0A6A5H895_CAERE|nr:hypothetical protein GCK72_011545 [Caenorhabditis remanei]KAF1763279.1 hypothetical protein GCK72_011545 [Caenorhabditis remanei]